MLQDKRLSTKCGKLLLLTVYMSPICSRCSCTKMIVSCNSGKAAVFFRCHFALNLLSKGWKKNLSKLVNSLTLEFTHRLFNSLLRPRPPTLSHTHMVEGITLPEFISSNDTCAQGLASSGAGQDVPPRTALVAASPAGRGRGQTRSTCTWLTFASRLCSLSANSRHHRVVASFFFQTRKDAVCDPCGNLLLLAVKSSIITPSPGRAGFALCLQPAAETTDPSLLIPHVLKGGQNLKNIWPW